VYDTRSGRQVSTVSGTDNCVNYAVVSADGGMLLSLVSAGFLGTPAEARLWTLGGPSNSLAFTGYDDGGAIGTFAQDGKTIATAGPEGAVNFWDPLTGRRLMTLPGFGEKISSLRFSGDGQVLTVGYAREVRLWYAAGPR